MIVRFYHYLHFFKKIKKEKGLIEKISNEMKEFFIPGPNHQHLLYEGFDPNELALEILSRNVEEMFSIILKEYPEANLAEFERDFSNIFKRTFGELIYEISEGLRNGYPDFELMLNENIKTMITRMVGPQMGDLVLLMAVPNLIPHVRNCYQDYKTYLEDKVSIFCFY
jgi:hypothetical protein